MNCPACRSDLQGAPIPPEHRHHYGGKTHWSRVCVHTVSDRTAGYWCPDCGHYWAPDAAHEPPDDMDKALKAVQTPIIEAGRRIAAEKGAFAKQFAAMLKSIPPTEPKMKPTQSASVVTCVYCGHEYPEGTPTAKHELLTTHIKTCEKHPMRQAEERIERLRKALSGLIGAETKEELEAMEVAMRIMPGIEADKIAGINAIHALLAEVTNQPTEPK